MANQAKAAPEIAGESTINATVEEFEREFPWVDRPTIEAQLSFAQAHAVLYNTMARKYAELGLSVSRFNALRLLHHALDQRLTITDLCVRLGISSASVTRLVDGLIRDGWVRRVNGEIDRRVTHVELLQAADQRFAALLPRVISIWNEVWSGLSGDEKEQLGNLNLKLRARLLADQSQQPDLDLVEY